MPDMPDKKTPAKPTDRTAQILRWVVGAIVTLALLVSAWYAYAYLSTPAALRHPTQTHYHFRLQLIVGGHPVNFADAKYQTEFNKDNCSALLTKEPIHFHDQLDQFVHIHWDHLTGGILLKQFGWNFIGGTPGTLGYRFDKFPQLTRIKIHGADLPTPPAGSHFYVYTGDQNGYRERTWDDFLDQDLHTLFTGTPSESLTDHAPAPSPEAGSQEALAKLNDVIGSVVIFAQPNPPTAAQIKDRFSHLIALPESACAG